MEIVWKNNIIQLMMVYNNYEECGKEEEKQGVQEREVKSCLNNQTISRIIQRLVGVYNFL